MKSAERGEINTHNLMLCPHEKNGNKSSKSPCTCPKT